MTKMSDRNRLTDHWSFRQLIRCCDRTEHQTTTGLVETCPDCEISQRSNVYRVYRLMVFNEGVMCWDYFLLYLSTQYVCAASPAVARVDRFGRWAQNFWFAFEFLIYDHISVCFWFCGIFCVICLVLLLLYFVRTLLKNTFLISMRLSWLRSD